MQAMRLHVRCLALAIIVLTGCETMTGYDPGSSGYDTVPDGEKAEAVFGGGDGSSIKRAVVITETANEKTGVRAEYVWLHQHTLVIAFKASSCDTKAAGLMTR